MLTTLKQVLDPDQLAFVQQRMRESKYIDGKLSAGRDAKAQKNNQELTDTPERLGELNNLIMGALVRHPTYLNAGLPNKIAAPFYCRYKTGMEYGYHIDDPIMGLGHNTQYRADIAITLFLNEPATYQGGELEIETTFGTTQIKLPAGDGIMYPASSRHRVKAIESGERNVAITWMQSLIPEPNRRELLYELYKAKENLATTAPTSEVSQQVSLSYNNLIRMWSKV